MLLGELISAEGNERIELTRPAMLVGRRESCDITLRELSISGRHAELKIIEGYWYVADRNSKNGVRVNGTKVEEHRLDPGDVVAFAKEKYEIRYDPAELGAVGPLPPEVISMDVFDRPFMDYSDIKSEDSGVSLGS